ncbi:MAG TPA: hypothetical protein VJ911_10510, partial [Cryomorphaceae bacterium]|nr:hypothetical protein [Cryomorphaceae bacterium]
MKLFKKNFILVFISALAISCNGQYKQQAEKSITAQQNRTKSIEGIPLPENGFYCGFLDSKGI